MVKHQVFVKKETFIAKIYANNVLILAMIHLLENERAVVLKQKAEL